MICRVPQLQPALERGMSPREAVAASADRSPRGGGHFARNSAYGTIAGLCAALGSLLTSVIVAHSLGVESTGVIAFALWVVILAAAVADLGIQATLARYLPELIAAGRTVQAARLTALLRRDLTLACGAALAGFAGYGAWQWHAGGEEPTIWVLVGLACALQALAGFTYGYLRGVQRFNRLALMTAISLAAQLIIVALGSLTFGILGALAGYCAGSVLPAVMSLRLSRSAGPLDAVIRARARRYAIYAWAGALSSAFVWSRAEVFFLNRSAGSAAVGLFTVGLTLANLASQGPLLLTTGLLPYFAQNFGRGALAELREAYAVATRVLAFLVFPACFGMAAVLPALLPMLYGEAFADAVPAAMILVLAAGIGSASSVGSSVVMALDRSDFIFVSGLIAALLSVVAGFTAIPAFGLIGAAWARAAIQVSAVALGSWFVYYRLHLPLPLRDLAKLLFAAALCGAAARACLFLAPGGVSLLVAILAGAAVYIVSVRLLRALPASDIDRLRAMIRPLPAPFRAVAELGLRALAAETAPQSPVGAPAMPADQPPPLAAALGIRGGRNAG
jgi:O-antigen/teichoic acid export membrane protein